MLLPGRKYCSIGGKLSQQGLQKKYKKRKNYYTKMNNFPS